jgi:hypothetical protein
MKNLLHFIALYLTFGCLAGAVWGIWMAAKGEWLAAGVALGVAAFSWAPVYRDYVAK